MLKFCEFLHRIRAIFYLRFRPLDVPMYAFGTKNEDFRSGFPYPLSAFEGSSSFFELELPSSCSFSLAKGKFHSLRYP